MKNSKRTVDAYFSSFGPYAIANLLMLIAIALFAIFQPDWSGPTQTAQTIWSTVVIGAILIVAGGFIIKGGLRLRKLNRSARDDRRRLAAGLPLDPEN